MLRNFPDISEPFPKGLKIEKNNSRLKMFNILLEVFNLDLHNLLHKKYGFGGWPA